jgi:hypothetical protein
MEVLRRKTDGDFGLTSQIFNQPSFTRLRFAMTTFNG